MTTKKMLLEDKATAMMMLSSQTVVIRTAVRYGLCLPFPLHYKLIRVTYSPTDGDDAAAEKKTFDELKDWERGRIHTRYLEGLPGTTHACADIVELPGEEYSDAVEREWRKISENVDHPQGLRLSIDRADFMFFATFGLYVARVSSPPGSSTDTTTFFATIKKPKRDMYGVVIWSDDDDDDVPKKKKSAPKKKKSAPKKKDTSKKKKKIVKKKVEAVVPDVGSSPGWKKTSGDPFDEEAFLSALNVGVVWIQFLEDKMTSRDTPRSSHLFTRCEQYCDSTWKRGKEQPTLRYEQPDGAINFTVDRYGLTPTAKLPFAWGGATMLEDTRILEWKPVQVKKFTPEGERQSGWKRDWVPPTPFDEEKVMTALNTGCVWAKFSHNNYGERPVVMTLCRDYFLGHPKFMYTRTAKKKNMIVDVYDYNAEKVLRRVHFSNIIAWKCVTRKKKWWEDIAIDSRPPPITDSEAAWGELSTKPLRPPFRGTRSVFGQRVGVAAAAEAVVPDKFIEALDKGVVSVVFKDVLGRQHKLTVSRCRAYTNIDPPEQHSTTRVCVYDIQVLRSGDEQAQRDRIWCKGRTARKVIMFKNIIEWKPVRAQKWMALLKKKKK